MIRCVLMVGLLSFRINVGVHWLGSVRSWFICRGYVDYNTRWTPATTDVSNLHGRFVDIDATLLGSRSPPAPGSVGSLASSPHSVGFLSIPMIICSLT